MKLRDQRCLLIYYILSTLGYFRTVGTQVVLKEWVDEWNLFATYSLCESEDRFPTYSLANGLPFTSTTTISVPNCIPRACHDLYASMSLHVLLPLPGKSLFHSLH